MSSEPALASRHADIHTHKHTLNINTIFVRSELCFSLSITNKSRLFSTVLSAVLALKCFQPLYFWVYCVCNNTEYTFTWYIRKLGFIKTTRRCKHLLWSTNYIKGSSREARTVENYHCINKLWIYFKYILYFLHSQKVLGLNQGWGLSLWHFYVSPCLYVWCSLIMSQTEGGVSPSTPNFFPEFTG